MRISKRHTVVRLLAVLLVLGVLAFLSVGCKTAAPANGTINVKLINAAAQNTKNFQFAVFNEGADWAVDDPVGVNQVLIAGGTAEGLAMDLDTGTTVVSFTGGSKYYVGALVDVNSSGGPPDSGDLMYVGSAFTVDGNRTETLDLASFTVY